MKRNYVALALLAVTALIAALFTLLQNHVFQVFDPKGVIALEERGLIIHAVLLMLIVVIPVFILGFSIAWHYRAENTKATYTPNWESSPMEELIWWAIPFEIILVIGALTWSSTHALDPYKPLPGAAPLTIEVVALDWKWLFIYPSLGIATINEVDFPVNQPVEFKITADAPMNSFWIPQLGGQIYAMTGMVTQLHLEASETGIYKGYSANYSGDGFADMNFNADALTPQQFDAWVAAVKQTPQTLDDNSYGNYVKPGTTTPQLFGTVEDTLYNKIVQKFLQPADSMQMDH